MEAVLYILRFNPTGNRRVSYQMSETSDSLPFYCITIGAMQMATDVR